MQSLPSVSVDLMPAGPPATPSAAKTGHDGVFAAHLATASQEQAPSTRPQEALSKQESDASRATHAPLSGEKTDNDDSPDDPSLAGASVNGSAGAANAGIYPTPWAGADAGRTPGQAGARSREESAVSQLLNTITSAAEGTMPGAQGKRPAAPTEGATTMLARNEATVPAFTLATPQPHLSSTDPAKAPAESTGVPAQQNPGDGEGTGVSRMEAAATQPRITVSFDTGTATAQLNRGDGEAIGVSCMDATATQPQITVSFGTDAVVSASGAADATGQAAPATLLTTGQIHPGQTQTAASQGATQPATDQIVQNGYGQIITIHQTGEAAEEVAVPVVTGGKTAPTATTSQQQDVNNNYIHSHLPNETSKTETGESGGQQQDTTKGNQPELVKTTETVIDGQPQPEQMAPQKAPATISQESQPLIFTPHRTSGALTGSTLTADSSVLRLPSGLTVPAGTVVDQMIAHFSVNKRLESGTVNLKLNPQELGELRMEIKVEQDNIKAHIVAQNPQAQEMIDRHLPRLREALEQQGLNLQQVEVTIAANDHRGGERFQENTGQQHLNHSMRKGSGQPVFTLDTDEEASEAAQAANNLSVLA